MDISKTFNRVVINHKRKTIDLYEGDVYTLLYPGELMSSCRVDMCDSTVKIDGYLRKVVLGEYEDLEGMSGKDISDTYEEKHIFIPNPRIAVRVFGKNRIVRDWAFKGSLIILKKKRRVAKILSLNNYNVNIYR